MAILRDYVVSIKGPLTTPVGGGIRSLNVALRQELDLYVCLRPVRYFTGVPSPVKAPEKTDMVIFRENSEDIYAGIEWQAESENAKKLIKFLIGEMGVKKIRFPATSGIGIKPVSREGTSRLMRKAIQYAIDNDRKSVTIVHKGNIMKFTEGGFRDWAYELAQKEFGAAPIDGGPWCKFKNPKTGRDIVVKDAIADAFLQQILLRPEEYDVIATLNLNGDYISDALAAQVGGIGIAPGANLSDTVAMFEATHGTAPKYAGKDYVNPGSEILSAEMMLVHMGWKEAAALVVKSLEKAIADKVVTYDFARSDAWRDTAVVLRLRQCDDRADVGPPRAGPPGRRGRPRIRHMSGARGADPIRPQIDPSANAKSPPAGGLFVSAASRRSLRRWRAASGGLDVRRLLALRALGHFEADLLALLQRLESRHVDCREMGEQVFTAAIRRNESEALCIVEPLDRAGCHIATSSKNERGFRLVGSTICGRRKRVYARADREQQTLRSQTGFFYASARTASSGHKVFLRGP